MLSDLVNLANSGLKEGTYGELSTHIQTHTGEYVLDIELDGQVIGGVDDNTLILYMPLFDRISGFMATDYLKLRAALRWKALKFIIGKGESFDTPMDELKYFLSFYESCPYAHVFRTKRMELSPSVFKIYLLVCNNKVMAEVHEDILIHNYLCRQAELNASYIISVLSKTRPMEVIE